MWRRVDVGVRRECGEAEGAERVIEIIANIHRRCVEVIIAAIVTVTVTVSVSVTVRTRIGVMQVETGVTATAYLTASITAETIVVVAAVWTACVAT